MNNSPYDGNSKFGGSSYNETPGSYKFDANPSYDDISSTNPNRSSAIDVNAEAKNLGIGFQTEIEVDQNFSRIFGEYSNAMEVLSGNVNLNISELANLLANSARMASTGGATAAPPTSPSPPASTTTPTPSTPGAGVALSLTTALAAEIKRLKEALKNQETINQMQKDQIDMVQDAVNKISIQDSKTFDENMTLTVSSQNFFFDLRKSEASAAPAWT